LKGAFLFVVVAVVTAAVATIPNPQESPLADAVRFAFYMQMRILREYYPRPLANDVVFIGIDEDTEDAFPEPVALWHRHLADVMHALARAKPKAVGVDIVLPERSYDYITRGLDLAMMRGLLDIKRAAVLVYVQTVNSAASSFPCSRIFAASSSPLISASTSGRADPDLVSRRFGERLLSPNDTPVPTLAGQLLRGLGLPVGEGFIDYSLGAPVEYVPMYRVAEWKDDTARLENSSADAS
jgi:hypothetical protein